MTTTNTERVHKFRQNQGNELMKKKYTSLRTNFNIPSRQADKMKYWSEVRITKWLLENGYIKYDFYKDVINSD